MNTPLNTLELWVVNKVLIFDFDGVLADSLTPMLRYAQQVCGELGYPCDPTQEDLEALERMEFSEYGLQLGIPPEKIDAFVKCNFELFNSREESLAIFPGMVNVISRLADILTLAIITGNSRKTVYNFLQAHKLTNQFSIVLAAEDDGNRVEKIQNITAKFNRRNTEYYLIGDAISDVRAAQKAGIKSVAVGWGHQSMQKLLKGNPDYTVGNPADLLKLFAEIQGKDRETG